MCEGSTPTLPFCDAQGSENPAPPFITDVRSSSREAASQSSRSNFRAVTESLAVPFHHITSWSFPPRRIRIVTIMAG